MTPHESHGIHGYARKYATSIQGSNRCPGQATQLVQGVSGIGLRASPAVARLTVYRRPQVLLYEPLLSGSTETLLYDLLYELELLKGSSGSAASYPMSFDFTYGLKYCSTSHRNVPDDGGAEPHCAGVTCSQR